MMDCAISCLRDHWPVAAGVLAALAPSLIVALTRHGRGKAGALALLLRLLDRLSVLSHKDARGTMKVPGRASEPHP